MEVECRKTVTDAFVPREITIKFEDQEEMNKFFAILNYSTINDAVEFRVEARAINGLLSPHVAREYEPWHTKLGDAIRAVRGGKL